MKSSRAAPFTKRLSRDEELAMFKAGRSGDVVVAHIPLAFGVAHRFARGRDHMLDDLRQEGCVGLMIAASKFDPNLGFRFTTYAIPWVSRLIREHIRRGRRMVSMPVSDGGVRAMGAMARGGIESAEQLAKDANISESVAGGIYRLLCSVELSTERHLEGGEVVEWLASSSDPEAEVRDAQDAAVRSIDIARAMVSLTDQERTIVDAMVLSDEPISGTEMGERLGVSRQRVNQVLQSAMRKITKALRPASSERVRVGVRVAAPRRRAREAA